MEYHEILMHLPDDEAAVTPPLAFGN